MQLKRNRGDFASQRLEILEQESKHYPPIVSILSALDQCQSAFDAYEPLLKVERSAHGFLSL